jgi:MFS family permease
VATAWSLASAVTQTIAGRCSDIFGRRNFTLAGNLSSLIGMLTGKKISTLTQN